MLERARPEWLHHQDNIGLILNLIERVANNNRSHIGTSFMTEIRRVHAQLDAMVEAGLLFEGEREVIERCFREFDHWNDYTRDTVSMLLRQLYPQYLTEPPNWVDLAEERRRLYGLPALKGV